MDPIPPTSWLRATSTRGNWLSWAILGAFLLMGATGAAAHEPWFDEAQSWLLARDAGPWDLVWRLLRYEGHPPLWHFVLMPLAKGGLPYACISYVAVAAAALGVALLVFHPRVPLVFKAVLPFTYYFAYQYAVVARSYSLLFPLLMGVFWLWPKRVERSRRFVALLVLLSLTSLHGLSLAGGLFLYTLLDPEARASLRALPWRRRGEALAILGGTFLFLVLILLPPSDLAIKGILVNPAGGGLLRALRAPLGLCLGLAGDAWLGGLAFLAILGWLHTRRQLGLALLLQVCLVPICTLYLNFWHQGLFVEALLLPVLLACQEETGAPGGNPGRVRSALGWVGLGALALVAALQATWTYHAWTWDRENPYSGSKAMAEALRGPVQRGETIAAFGFVTLGIEPYYPRNIFANYRLKDGGAYWDWSRRAPLFYAPGREVVPAKVAAWTRAQLAASPRWLVVSGKFGYETLYLDAIRADGRYRLVGTTPGAIVWQGGFAEMEPFALFRLED